MAGNDVRPRRMSRLVRLERPRVWTTYQLQAEVGHKLKSEADLFAAARQEITDWLSKKAPVELPASAAKGESFVVDEHGQRIECVSIPDHGVWTCRLSHPDMGMGDIEAVPGRHWTTDLCLRRIDGKVMFGVNVACAMLQTDHSMLTYARPAIVRNLAISTGLIQVRPLMHEPSVLSSPERIDDLEKLLLSTDRSLPVIIFSMPDRKRWHLTQSPPPPYLVDALYVAKELQGYAHVIQLTYPMGYEWTKRVGAPWAVFDGAIRIYQPGLNFDEDDLRAHPLYRKDMIWYHKYHDHSGPKAFTDQLLDVIRAQNARGRWTIPELVTVAQARLLASELNAAQIRAFTQEKEEAFQKALEKLADAEKGMSVASDAASQMRELVKAKDDAAKALHNQVEELTAALKETQVEAEQWSDLAKQADQDREYFEKLNYNLRNQINVLRANLEAKTGEQLDVSIPIPESYEDMEEWAGQYLADRLELHPRTRRSLKRANYEDVPLVYKALLVLANEYRNMKLGHGDNTMFEEALGKLGLKCSGSIDEARAGSEGDAYYVEYPPGSRKREFLALHLRKGKVKDDRHCLAIYFFWHDATQQVVVGWLPSHLDNQLS
ncbi:MAG TPA: hypothetical protein PKA21_08880 [Kiritimatiellia bacterium]|nr:hypothetical protein [Kiritimatiellia bacterium]HMP35033.1 hypothetical protein [Kiritimatiellia bacterium]